MVMEINLNIQSFGEIWLDCQYNMYFSILQSMDYSYYYMALENCYEYLVHDEITNYGTELNMITNRVLFDRELYFEEIEVSVDLCGVEDLLEKIYDFLKMGKYVLVGVDLYDWIPESSTYHKYHWQHYALVTGISSCFHCVYVLDAAEGSYKEYKIPQQRFYNAVAASDYKSKLRILSWKHKGITLPYAVSCTKLYENAKQINESIEFVMGEKFWLLSDDEYNTLEYMDLSTMYIYRIFNRHKGNITYFKFLQSELGLDTEKYVKVERELADEWKLIQYKLVMNYHGRERHNRMLQLNAMAEKALLKELEMWREFQKGVI